jgi:hypothetical protein
VSGEEYSVYVSALEHLVFAAQAHAIEAYTVVWEQENMTGASPFTPAGRFQVAALVLAQAQGLRTEASMDGQPGQGKVVYLTLRGLAGPVASNASVSATVTLQFTWESLSSFEAHALAIDGPDLLAVEVHLHGGAVARDVAGLGSPVTRKDGSLVEGTTSLQPLTMTIAQRPATFTGVGLAVTVIVGVAVVVGYGALILARAQVAAEGSAAAQGKPK